MNKEVILIPDVHGRTFWKSVTNEDCPIVFLGDYLDPYVFEGTNKEGAIENFKEILEFARTHKNVQLLTGNHDCEYMLSQAVCNCRCDYDNYDYIRKLFRDNRDLFKLMVEMNIGGKRFVFSHAGIHPNWLNKKRYRTFDISDINDMLDYDNGDELWYELCDVSRERGGDCIVGSIVWADIREFHKGELDCFDFEQVVGHTYLRQEPMGVDGITCIDLQRPFFIDEKGLLREMDCKLADKINLN